VFNELIIIKDTTSAKNASLHYFVKPQCSEINLISTLINASCIVSLQTGLMVSSDFCQCQHASKIISPFAIFAVFDVSCRRYKL